MLKPVPVRDPGTLYQVLHTGDAGTFESSTYAFYEHVRSRSDLVAGALLVDPAYPQRIVLDGQAHSAATQRVSGDYYRTLGVTPVLGRVIQSSDEHGGVPNRVAVLGHAYWMNRFGGDTGVLGRTVIIDDQPHTIVGVTGPEFFGLQVGRRADVTIPLDGHEEQTFWKSRALLVRLAPGVSRDAAATGLEAAFQHYLAQGEPMSAADADPRLPLVGARVVVVGPAGVSRSLRHRGAGRPGHRRPSCWCSAARTWPACSWLARRVANTICRSAWRWAPTAAGSPGRCSRRRCSSPAPAVCLA